MSFPMESLRIQTGLDPRNQCILIHDRLADRTIRRRKIDSCRGAFGATSRRWSQPADD